MTDRKNAGFTLIELLIVVAIIAVIAGIAIPNLLSARASANEKSVIALLRTIVTAQQQARTNSLIDLNNNGTGEAATLEELAGTQTVRGSLTALTPPCLSVTVGNPDADGHVLSNGYYICLYLPDATGQGLSSTPANLPQVNALMAESYWSVVAWPRSDAAQSNATYFTNPTGDILITREGNYVGKANQPQPGCALLGVPATHVNSVRNAANNTGADGNNWRVVP